MPSVTYNGQSFAIDSRRFWIVGASIHYARLPEAAWRRTIAAARDAGCNTIETACPWCLHEPRPGRFEFSGQADVRQFITLCAEMGMRVIVRVGPYIGSGFDGGGLPAWLGEIPGIKLREANEHYLEHVFTYLRKLLNELDGLQATKAGPGSAQGGPIILIQAEHAWQCANPNQATKYLRELNRVIRECGFNVPITNANDLWQEVPGTLDTWRGSTDLLEHLRQFRTVQPDAPRLLSMFEVAESAAWGDPRPRAADKPAVEVLHNLAQCLAAGAQPVVSPFAAGINIGFLGGRLPGAPGRFCTTAAAAGAPLGEAGARGARFTALRRLLTFANHFGHVFAELDAEYQPVVPAIPPAAATVGAKKKTADTTSHDQTVIPLEGSQGRIVFVFHSGAQRSTELLLDNGVRMPIQLPDQPVAWYVLDADLNGSGRLDYANLCPLAIVNRSILVLFGPERAEAYLSINGSPLNVRVPGGQRPLVVDHKGITVVLCSEQQIDQTYADGKTVYVGVAGFNADHQPILARNGQAHAWAISADAKMRSLPPEETVTTSNAVGTRAARSIALGEWAAASASSYASGDSPRFATLSGPSTLMSCGAATGYGWYRITLQSSSARKRLCTLPEAADRVQLFVNGSMTKLFGVGPGAAMKPFELKLERGENVIVALADNMGRFADGNELIDRKGLFGHIWEVKAMKATKPKQVQGTPIDPFTLRGYIAGLTKGQLSEREQVEWRFKHAKKSPILVDINSALCTGTFILNDQPIAYFAGATGSTTMRLLIGSETHDSFKRGNNILRFAPDQGQPKARSEISKATMLYECTEALSESASWSFAKWDPPAEREYEAVSKHAAKQMRGAPCWWRASFEGPEHLHQPLWFDTRGLSKGQVFINGRNLGRYFTSSATGKAVGPQTRLWVPTSWLKAGQENELIVFDEHGFDPSRTRLALSAVGDLDEPGK